MLPFTYIHIHIHTYIHTYNSSVAKKHQIQQTNPLTLARVVTPAPQPERERKLERDEHSNIEHRATSLAPANFIIVVIIVQGGRLLVLGLLACLLACKWFGGTRYYCSSVDGDGDGYAV